MKDRPTPETDEFIESLSAKNGWVGLRRIPVTKKMQQLERERDEARE